MPRDAIGTFQCRLPVLSQRITVISTFALECRERSLKIIIFALDAADNVHKY
jgi:hypothetical protein